jgi:HEAT repeat protein
MRGIRVSRGKLSMTPATGPGGFPDRARVMHPSGRFLYSAGPMGDGIEIHEIDPESGALTVVDASADLRQAQPRSLTISSDGRWLFLADGRMFSLAIARIDETSGRLVSFTGGPKLDSLGIVRAHPNGPMLIALTTGFASWACGYAIEADGRLRPLPGFPIDTGPAAVEAEFHPSGRFFFVLDHPNGALKVFEVRADGTLAAVAGSPFAVGGKPAALAVSGDGHFLYAATEEDQRLLGFRIAPSGAISPIPEAVQPTGGIPISLTMTPSRGPVSSRMTLELPTAAAEAFAVSSREQPASLRMDRDNVETLIGRLRDEDYRVRYYAAIYLGRTGEAMGTEGVDALIAALVDSNAAVSEHAAYAIVAAGPNLAARAVPALTSMLKHSEPGRRRAAADALGRLGVSQESAVQALAEATTAPDYHKEATAAVRALGRAGSEQAAGPLLDAFLSEDLSKQRAAAEALRSLGPKAKEAVPGLTAAVGSRNDRIRLDAARILGSIGHDAGPAIPELFGLLDDTPRVRDAAREAIVRIRGNR